MHAPGSETSEVGSSWINRCLPPEVQYACLYWVQHLQRGSSQVHDGEEVHRFLQAYLLHWLEALGWMGKTAEGIRAIVSLESYIFVKGGSNLHTFIHDAKRFAFHNRSVIKQVPLQLYCSALIFAPDNSIVRKTFENCIPDWIQLKAKVHWNAALQAHEGHSLSLYSMAFSSDGKRVVSGSYDTTVRLWDAATGALLQTLEGHTRPVTSVAFSADGKKVASGSRDCTVRFWDTAGGVPLQTLKDHRSNVTSMAFSSDGKQVVSGSQDGTVRLWDAVRGVSLRTLEGHRGSVTSVTFSPDGKRVASEFWERTVRFWDATTGTPLQTLEGQRRSVASVAFPPGGKLLSAFQVSDLWVMEDDTNILWLPPDDWKTCSVTWNRSLVIGHSSGRISFFCFKKGAKLV